MSDFILSAESTIDMPYSYARERDINILFYTYMVDEKEFVDDMGRDPQALPRFYEMLEAGKMPITSQINVFRYQEYFEELLNKYEGDILHITLGSGMTSSINNAITAADLLEEKHPDRKIKVIDSICSSSGYGLLVDAVYEMKQEGKSLDEIANWVLNNRINVQHQFYSTDLKFFRRSGRMRGAAAKVGAILNICPMMRLDYDGKIIAYDKVRGKKLAIRSILKIMEKYAADGLGYAGKCFVCHSNCIEDAKDMAAAIQKKFTKIKGSVQIFDIGTIIASHCGPGTVAVFFFGSERLPSTAKM